MNQQQPKEVGEELKQTGGFIFGGIHASVIQLRLISRVPGSLGAGYLFPGAIWGWACMGILPQVLFHTEQTRTLLPVFITVTGWLFVIHLFYYFQSHRKGIGTYAYLTGIGWLNKLNPKAKDPASLATANDIFFALALAFICFLYGDEMLGKWWLLNTVLCIASTTLLSVRDAARKRQFRSAMYDQKYWQDEIMRGSVPNDEME